MNCLSPLIFRKKCFLTNLWLRFCLFYRAFSKYMCWVHAQSLSCFLLFATLWTVALQAPLSIEFSRQAYWSGLTFPSPGIFLTQGSNPHLLHWQVDSLLWAPGKHSVKMCARVCVCSVMSDSFQPLLIVAHQAPLSLELFIRDTCHFLFQGIFPIQGLNLHLLCLLHW